MIEAIRFANGSKFQKVKNASKEALARTHNIRSIKEENKFIESTEKLNTYIDDWSLKAIPQFLKSVKHFGKMAGEKLKSAYYYQKH